MERIVRGRATTGTEAHVKLPDDLDAWLTSSEAEVPALRPDAAKTIVWADAARHAQTALSLVYLHGFSADRHEVEPLPRLVAEGLEANVYYTRLTGHGRDGAAMGEATVADWLADTDEALRIGARLGRRVVLMGTSTGGSLAMWAATQPEWRGSLAALVLVSPNFGLRHPAAPMLAWPVGGLVARLLVGKERRFEPENERQAHHWTVRYPSSALLPLMRLVRDVRALPLETVTVPVFVAYSKHDRVVAPRATRRALARLGSAEVHMHRVEGDGDPSHHVLAGDILSPATTESLAHEILTFLERIL